MATKQYLIPARGVSTDWYVGFGITAEPVEVQPGYMIVEADDASGNLSALANQVYYNTIYGGAIHEMGTAGADAVAARAFVTVEVADDGDVLVRTESERIASGATFSGDNITRTLPAVSGLRDGHRVRFCDPHGELGGALPTLSLVLATADSATFRYGGTTGATFTTAREGGVVDVELVKGAQGDGSDSVWLVGGDGGGLLGL